MSALRQTENGPARTVRVPTRFAGCALPLLLAACRQPPVSVSADDSESIPDLLAPSAPSSGFVYDVRKDFTPSLESEWDD